MTPSEAFAPAKVNLFLHVGRPDGEGYHPLSSLAVFADVGDRMMIEAAERFSVESSGPFAAGLPGTKGNLVAKAAAALFAPAEPPALRVRIDKRLPVAAGLGGGSSDAGAMLRWFVAHGEVSLAALGRAALAIGSDGPACFTAEPVLMQGRGEVLSSPPPLPLLHAVLVNPGAPCPTGAVYRAYDADVCGNATLPEFPHGGFPDADALIRWLADETRNDLEDPALRVQPVVAETLVVLRGEPSARLVRMSGSGATCFALFDGERAAEEAAGRLRETRPDWWVAPCRLGGPWPADSARR